MIATKKSDGRSSSDQLPNSTKVYVRGTMHHDVRAPFREITLNLTRAFNGATEENAPVRVYDTSGPWGDQNQQCEVGNGLPPLRREWIVRRGDIEEYCGRHVQPRDNGYLTEGHAG